MDERKRPDDPCPLCRGRRGTVLWSIPYADIWHGLQRCWGFDVPVPVRAPWDALGQAALVACDTCDLHYFDPALAGNADFWAEFSKQCTPYTEYRWEWDRVLAGARTTDSLIDFGSGGGAFLRHAQPKVGRVVGCDHNEGAEIVASSGPEVRHDPFDVVAGELAGQFDIATSFHVIEHLADVAEVCEPAILALRPGGRLFVSMPDRMRTARDDFEPLDCPPHHISRWGVQQFEHLAQRFDLELRGVRHEPFVARRGMRRHVPGPILDVAGIIRHRTRGTKVQWSSFRDGPPRPRGSAILGELHKP